MFDRVSRNLRATILAVLVHVVLIVFLLIGFNWAPKEFEDGDDVDIVQAVVIDEQMVLEELEAIKRQEQNELDRKKKLEADALAAKRKREAEERKLRELKKKAADEKRVAAELAKKQALEQEALRKKRAAEEKRVAELEEKRKQEEEARIRAEEEKRHKEAELAMKEQLAVEQQRLEAERAKRLQSMRSEYIAAIARKVERNWIKPANVTSGLSCKVRVQQVPGGEVVAAAVTECNADAVVKRSVESAVYKSSPLPPPADAALFDREIIFVFTPRD